MFSFHGVFVSVNGFGVLLKGRPGVGKSQLALDLVDRGHKFIADDLILFSSKGCSLYGSACDKFNGFLMIRGFGLLEVSKLYPDNFIKEEKLAVIVELCSERCDTGIFLNQPFEYIEFGGFSYKKYKIYVNCNIPLGILIESIIRENFICIKKNGTNEPI